MTNCSASPVSELPIETVTYRRCGMGHVFVWAGDPDYKLPDGYPCECEMTVVHYERCPTCRHQYLSPTIRDEER